MAERQKFLLLLAGFITSCLGSLPSSSLGSLPSCDPDNRDCSCADASLQVVLLIWIDEVQIVQQQMLPEIFTQGCQDFTPSTAFHADGIEECMSLCQVINSYPCWITDKWNRFYLKALNGLGQCDWFLYPVNDDDDELFIPPYKKNCEV